MTLRVAGFGPLNDNTPIITTGSAKVPLIGTVYQVSALGWLIEISPVSTTVSNLRTGALGYSTVVSSTIGV